MQFSQWINLFLVKLSFQSICSRAFMLTVLYEPWISVIHYSLADSDFLDNVPSKKGTKGVKRLFSPLFTRVFPWLACLFLPSWFSAKWSYFLCIDDRLVFCEPWKSANVYAPIDFYILGEVNQVCVQKLLRGFCELFFISSFIDWHAIFSIEYYHRVCTYLHVYLW